MTADSYIIKGGAEGRGRLSVLSRVLEPTTEALLNRACPAGPLAVDAGCGGGDVTLAIARRLHPAGRVVGLEFDETKLALARDEAAHRGVENAAFVRASVVDPWPVAEASFVYIRFVLTHLSTPERLLANALQAMRQGAVIAVEDIDFAGHFADPPCPAFDRYVELYAGAARARGVDAFIGRRLHRLLEDAGFADIRSSLVQPYGRSGEVKELASLTLSAITDSVVACGLATSAEVAEISSELAAFTARPDTTLSMPRIFQAWARKP